MNKGMIWPNLRIVNGLSRDMANAFIGRTHPGGALVMDDPGYAIDLASAGYTVIYRQSGDDPQSDPLGQWTPEQFVLNRIHPGFEQFKHRIKIHLTNECGPSKAVDQFNRQCSDFAHSADPRAGYACVLLNHSANKTPEEWELSHNTLQICLPRGDSAGFHFYDDFAHLTGAYGWQSLMQRLGGSWIATEIAYLRDLTDANRGYKNFLSDERHNQMWEEHATYFHALGIILCAYSLDDWPIGSEGEQTGLGYNGNEPLTIYFTLLNAKYPLQEKPMIPIPTSPQVAMTLTKLPSAYVNIRDQPDVAANDLGDLRLGDVVQVRVDPAVPNWVYVDASSVSGWVSLQNGSVAFTPITVLPPPPLPTPTITPAQMDRLWTSAQAMQQAAADVLAVLREVAPTGGF